MFYYVKNLQGDIVKILDEDGQEKASYVYNAWGNILSQSNDELSSINPLRYRGYVYDEDTAMYYLQTRYYDPTTGRFINADDTAYIGATGTVLSANIFTYCENNPIVCSDKTGNYTAKTNVSYTIQYNANGGKGNMKNTIVRNGKMVTLRENKFKKTNYTFKCWLVYRTSDRRWLCVNNKERKLQWFNAQERDRHSNYKLHTFPDKLRVGGLTSKNNDKIILYAIWKRSTKTLSFSRKLDIDFLVKNEHGYTFFVIDYLYKEKYFIEKSKATFNYRSLYAVATFSRTEWDNPYVFTASGITHINKKGKKIKYFGLKFYTGDTIYPLDKTKIRINKFNRDSAKYNRKSNNYGQFTFTVTAQYCHNPYSTTLKHSLNV